MTRLDQRRIRIDLAVVHSPKADYSSFIRLAGTVYNLPMEAFQTLKIDVNDGVASCVLNRPDRRNAINPEMIAELTRFFSVTVPAERYRVVVLRGSQGFFCAGADLGWMKESAGYSAQRNQEDALALFDAFAAINAAPSLTICAVEGGAFGGGIGIISCCDIAIATQDSRYSLSEVRLGLSPATISPFVSARIGASHARHLMLSAVPFNAQHALRIGLLHELCSADEMDLRIDEQIGYILQCAPEAVRRTKQLLFQNASDDLAELRQRSSSLIAELRTGAEGQEGLTAFIEKRKPGWVPRD